MHNIYLILKIIFIKEKNYLYGKYYLKPHFFI
jgi:uncharacterized membrane protein (UPF0127 family)